MDEEAKKKAEEEAARKAAEEAAAAAAKNGSVDYKAELEKEKKRREQAEFVIESLKKEKKEKDSGKEGQGEADDKTVDVEKIIEQKLEKFKLEAVGNNVQSILGQISATPEEAELIKHHYENTIKRSGYSTNDILNDLTRAKLLANEKKIIAENEELKKALGSRDTRKSPDTSRGDDFNKGSTQLSSDEEKLVASAVARGYKKEDVVKKILANKPR